MNQARRQMMSMAELLVFLRTVLAGLIVAEGFRLSFYAGSALSGGSSLGVGWRITICTVVLALCLTYMWCRNALASALRLFGSMRVDLLIVFLSGVWLNQLLAPNLFRVHRAVAGSNPEFGWAVLLVLIVLLLSPLMMRLASARKPKDAQFRFLEDSGITSAQGDELESAKEAEDFAKTVLACELHAGLVFGLDAPWGVGKTSFINLAENYWSTESKNALIVRFEPLVYANEPDLSNRLLRELVSAIQRKVFAPELGPVASRYWRMIRGRADISFFGIKYSLEPSNESIDDMLSDIDVILERTGKRLIIVVDDLDRLEAVAVNNVLFAVRRTFKLSRVTYILCYDTENLVGQPDSAVTREFLQKFVTIKKSLFVEGASLRAYLRQDWSMVERADSLGSAESMLAMSSILGTLAELLEGPRGASYMRIVGNLRQLKRFVNAALLLQIDKTDFAKTDFNRTDLIHLLLLHLDYPGVFRRLYDDETDNRSGIFSVKKSGASASFANHPELIKVIEGADENLAFLLRQLFSVDETGVQVQYPVNELFRRTRACLNQTAYRNLEKYLKLIVRFVVPQESETFATYLSALSKLESGTELSEVLSAVPIGIDLQTYHKEIWRLLVNRANTMSAEAVEKYVWALIKVLPTYSSVDRGENGPRHSSIYSLALLLNRLAYEDHTPNTTPSAHTESIRRVGAMIFGSGATGDETVLRRLVETERGPLGWHDALLFRLVCSADRGGQLHQLERALLLHQNPNAVTTGLVSDLTIEEMREVSQVLFGMFSRRYIEGKINFLDEVDFVSDKQLLGESDNVTPEGNLSTQVYADQLETIRSSVKSFVIYQLTNLSGPSGSGIGCGYYDPQGRGDSGQISKVVSKYLFEVCFNPRISQENAHHFLLHLLTHVSGRLEADIALDLTNPQSIGELDPSQFKAFWRKNHVLIKRAATDSRRIVTSTKVTNYEELGRVFKALSSLLPVRKRKIIPH